MMLFFQYLEGGVCWNDISLLDGYETMNSTKMPEKTVVLEMEVILKQFPLLWKEQFLGIDHVCDSWHLYT